MKSLLQQRRFYRKIFGAGTLLLFGLMLIAANLGVAKLSWSKTLMIIISRIPLFNQWVSLEQIDPAALIIILNLRLPRILLAAMLGAGLAVAGAVFQGIFKNSLADPFILGISAGAALGAAVAIVLGDAATYFGLGLITIAAFGGGVGTAWLVYQIAGAAGKVSNTTLLLAGMAANLFLTAIMSLLMTFRREQLERIIMWTMGSVATANWTEVLLLLPIVLGVTGIIMFFARDLNVLLIGEDNARSMGVEVEQVKLILLTAGTLLVAALVSVSGVVGFVGLIVPHMVRLVCGADYRTVVPFSALGGAILVIGCDTLARCLIPPTEIPLGIVTSILGAPFFLYLIFKAKKQVL